MARAQADRSRMTRLYKQIAGIRTLDWPARSPDLNPIEHVWAMLKRNVRRQIDPEDDLLQLEAKMKKEWDRLDQQKIDDLISSMPSRVHKVTERHGGQSGY